MGSPPPSFGDQKRSGAFGEIWPSAGLRGDRLSPAKQKQPWLQDKKQHHSCPSPEIRRTQLGCNDFAALVLDLEATLLAAASQDVAGRRATPAKDVTEKRKTRTE